MHLITKPNIARPDDFYAALVELHQGRDDAQSMKVSARLILALANHIGDEVVLREALRLAGDDGASPSRTD